MALQDRRPTALTLVALIGFNVGCSKADPPTQVQPPASPAPPTQSVDPVAPAASTPPSPAPSAPEPGTLPLSVAGLTFKIPADWKSVQPSSRMRLLQYSLPGEDGPVEVVISCFGKGQGGSRQENFLRWVNQFKNPVDPDKHATHQLSRFSSEFLSGLIVTCQGTYAPRPMAPNAPAVTPKLDYALHGAIIENGPSGTVFVKTTGPQTTVDAYKKTLDRFARSARLAD